KQRAAEDLAASRLVGRADEDVGRAPLAGDAADGLHEVVASLLEEVDAEQARNAPERRELCLLFRRGVAAIGMHPHRVDVGPATLGGSPGASVDALRLRLRLDEGEHALLDRLLAERSQLVDVPARLDILGHLAKRKLAQRGEVLVAEEVLERRL